MNATNRCVLTINGGSSSIKFALYEDGALLSQLFSGVIESIGSKNIKFHSSNAVTRQGSGISIDTMDHASTANFLIDWLEKQDGFSSLEAVGHRIVHGMKHSAPEMITPELIVDLKAISKYDPEHLPREIELIETFKKRFPDITQVACFDTSFHSSMPQVAKWVPIPRKYNAMGIQRYGFHGLSYSYLMEELETTAGIAIAQGRIILAHLGNGASLAAVNNKMSVDTTMGFTPASGLPMSTRTGDLDPGVTAYLLNTEKLSSEQFSNLINHESGLLGISETNSDMRELLKLRNTDSRAEDAIELFCYQTKKWIGSFAAALGGLDTLVFAGGIGENAPEIREQICEGLQFLGIELDKTKNDKNENVISTDKSKVGVRVIKTNEDLMIARSVCKILNHTNKS